MIYADSKTLLLAMFHVTGYVKVYVSDWGNVLHRHVRLSVLVS